MLSCAITWSILVAFYFISWLGLTYSHPNSASRAQETSMIIECFLDVIAKVFYLLVIVEMHVVIFDDGVRAARQLKEMREMMSAVWESSSDVIAISVRSGTISSSSSSVKLLCEKDGKVTTILSPTHKRLFELDKAESNTMPYKTNRRSKQHDNMLNNNNNIHENIANTNMWIQMQQNCSNKNSVFFFLQIVQKSW